MGTLLDIMEAQCHAVPATSFFLRKLASPPRVMGDVGRQGVRHSMAWAAL